MFRLYRVEIFLLMNFIEVKMKKISLYGIALSLFILFGFTAMPAQAELFFVGGKIVTSMSTASDEFGGCMIYLSNPVGNGCPNKGWVSLDCNDEHYDGGERRFATALMAFSLNKTVYALVDNQIKKDGYCVAKRIDVSNN